MVRLDGGSLLLRLTTETHVVALAKLHKTPVSVHSATAAPKTVGLLFYLQHIAIAVAVVAVTHEASDLIILIIVISDFVTLLRV